MESCRRFPPELCRMAPFSAANRAAAPSFCFLVSILASFICGHSDLQIDQKPIYSGAATAVSVTWTEQTSDFDSLYCVVVEDPDEVGTLNVEQLEESKAIETLSSRQVILKAVQLTRSHEEAKTSTTVQPQPKERAPETTMAPAPDTTVAPETTTVPWRNAQEEMQMRNAECAAVVDEQKCGGDCEWHKPEASDAENDKGECVLNAVMALQILGEAPGPTGDAAAPDDEEPGHEEEQEEEEQAPVRRTEQDTAHAVERLRGAATHLSQRPHRRLPDMPDDPCTGLPEAQCFGSECLFDQTAAKCVLSSFVDRSITTSANAILAVAEGEPLEACDEASSETQQDIAGALPAPCVENLDKHRAHFFFQGKLVPGKSYIAYCATRKGYLAHKVFSLDIPEEQVGTTAAANSSTNVSNDTSRGPRAAGGTTLEEAGDDASDGSQSGTLSAVGVVLIIVFFCAFFIKKKGARDVGGLLTQDHEMLQASGGGPNVGSYVGPGNLAETFSQLKDGPE